MTRHSIEVDRWNKKPASCSAGGLSTCVDEGDGSGRSLVVFYLSKAQFQVRHFTGYLVHVGHVLLYTFR